MKINKTPTGYYLEPDTSNEAQALEQFVKGLRSENVEGGSIDKCRDGSQATHERPSAPTHHTACAEG